MTAYITPGATNDTTTTLAGYFDNTKENIIQFDKTVARGLAVKLAAHLKERSHDGFTKCYFKVKGDCELQRASDLAILTELKQLQDIGYAVVLHRRRKVEAEKTAAYADIFGNNTEISRRISFPVDVYGLAIEVGI